MRCKADLSFSFADRLLAMTFALLVLLAVLAQPAAAVNVSDLDPNPGAIHEPVSVRSDFGPQSEELGATGRPFSVTLGDEITYQARIPVESRKSVPPRALVLSLDTAFELAWMEGSYLNDGSEVLGKFSFPESASLRNELDLSGMPDGTSVINVRYEVRAVKTLTTGSSGMVNDLGFRYDDDVIQMIQSTPVHTTALCVKFVDSKLPEQEPPKTASGNAPAYVPRSYYGQYVRKAQWVLYADQDCSRPVYMMPGFRRYDVCPDGTYGQTAIIEADEGPIQIVGLPEGTYYIKSIMPPEGNYGAPSAVIPVQMRLDGLVRDEPGRDKLPEKLDFVTEVADRTGTELVIDYAAMRPGRLASIESKAMPLAGAAAGLCCLTAAAVVTVNKRKKASK